jgi:hypothetical protein
MSIEGTYGIFVKGGKKSNKSAKSRRNLELKYSCTSVTYLRSGHHSWLVEDGRSPLEIGSPLRPALLWKKNGKASSIKHKAFISSHSIIYAQ